MKERGYLQGEPGLTTLLADSLGLEPRTFRLTAGRIYQLS